MLLMLGRARLPSLRDPEFIVYMFGGYERT
jgi:hypothetical protein